MGCFGSSGRPENVLAEHKFAYVNLSDFRSKSCLNYTAYFWIYMGTLISIACYAADIYTAVVLLAFNRWTNDTLEKSSLINFNIAKTVFSVCIFFSFVLLAIDWWIAVKVIKSDGVAEAYMNVIAVRFNCIWGGKGKGDTGWKRFLVFSRLTKSRGVLDYLALLTYFAFKGWVRIIFAEGPRVVINVLTLLSITQANVIMNKKGVTLEGFEKFGNNVKALYGENKFQVMILGTMAFTSFMWILAILRLLVAALIYICYLWHVMSGKQSLGRYCKDRIDTRMGEIVQKKHDKAIRKEKQQNKEFLGRQPTIPVITQGRKAHAMRYSADSQSSTTNLINPSPPHSLVSHTPPPPMYTMSREPTLPHIPELVHSTPVPSRIAPQRQQIGFRQPPNSRLATQRTNITPNTVTAQEYRGQLPYQADPQGPQQQPYPPTFDVPVQGWYQQSLERQRPLAQGEYARECGYLMQPLTPPNPKGRAPLEVDTMAQNNGWDNNNGQQSIRQGRFPVQPREPQMAAGQRPGWGGGPRSRTAGPQSQGAYGPPPRSQTAGPLDRNGPPPRGNTAGPIIQGNHGILPPRSQTAGPTDGGYCAPRSRTQDGYNAPPRSQTAVPANAGYAPPQRSQTAVSAEGAYCPPQRGGQEIEQGPRSYVGKAKYQPAQHTQERNQAAGPPPRAGFQPELLQRTQTAPIRAHLEEFGPPRRAGTAPPTGTEPPVTGTALPITLEGGFDNAYHSTPPKAANAEAGGFGEISDAVSESYFM